MDRTLASLDYVCVDSQYLFRMRTVVTRSHHAVGDHDIARTETAGERADHAGCDDQFGLRQCRERLARDRTGAFHPDSGGYERRLAVFEARAETTEPGEVQWGAISQPPLKRRDLARECVKNQDQLR